MKTRAAKAVTGATAGLAALSLLLCWQGPARAQNSRPIPYGQLTGHSRPTPARPRPRPHPRSVSRPAATPPAVAGLRPQASASPASLVSPPPLPLPARPPAPTPAGATFLPGTAPSDGAAPLRRAAPAPRAAAREPDLPSAAPPPGNVTVPGARLAPGSPLSPGETEAFVDGLVRQAGAERPLAGVAVAVVQGGTVVLEKGYGFARRAPATPVDPRATRFRLGSVSKVFTWIELLKAMEAGRLRLDDPVNARLPPTLRLPDEGFAAPVRVRNLLAHDAGFESREFGRLFRADPAQTRTLAETLRRERPNRVRAPGDMPTYSSYGAALGGFLAAQGTGRAFEDQVEADLLTPAGLQSTTFRELGAAASAAEGFVWTRRGLQAQSYGHVGGWAPALGVSSTANDMARLMLTLLADGRVAGSATPAWGPRTDAALRTPLSPGWTHGLMRYALPGGFEGLGHDGATPASRARLMIVPQLDLGVFVVGSSDTAERLAASLPALLVGRFYTGAPPLAPAAALPNASAYTGAYVSTRRAYHGLEGFVGRLTRLYRVRSEPDGALVVWGPEGGRRWFTTGRPGAFSAADGTGAPLTFLFDRAGRPRTFLDPAGQWGAERVGWFYRPEVLAGIAALAELAAVLTLAGLVVRDAREYRQSGGQTGASRVQAAAALLWLLALAAFTGFVLRAEPARLALAWPDPLLVAASVAALGATVLSLGQLAQLPGAWAAERRVHGWSFGRKLRHTLTAGLFCALAFVLLGWGALEPWSS